MATLGKYGLTECLLFRTNADLLFQDKINGDLFTQADKTLDLLFTKYLNANISYRGVQRIEKLPVPEAALREAVLNALIHKNYASGSPIQISVYSDKLMIWNSGSLPPDWTVEKLLDKHSSEPYNPDIANTFFRAGLIEAWGRGIERILGACRDANTPEPLVRYETTGLWLEFPFPKSFAPDSKNNDVTGQVTVQVTVQVTGQVTGQVNWQSLIIVATIQGEMSRVELMEALHLKHRDYFTESYLNPALKEKLLEMTIPEKPNSRLQKYRLTDKGKKLKSND